MDLLLARAELRTALLCRTVEQVHALAHDRRNDRYLPGVESPRDLEVRTLGFPVRATKAQGLNAAGMAPADILTGRLDGLAMLRASA